MAGIPYLEVRDIPTCAVCGRKVDEFIWFDPPDALGDRVLVVRCHGDEERVTLTVQDFRAAAMYGVNFVMGEAFATKRLPPYQGGSAAAIRVHNEMVEARFAEKIRKRGGPYR